MEISQNAVPSLSLVAKSPRLRAENGLRALDQDLVTIIPILTLAATSILQAAPLALSKVANMVRASAVAAETAIAALSSSTVARSQPQEVKMLRASAVAQTIPIAATSTFPIL